MKKVVVTGASGHIGYHVADILIDESFEVHCLVRKENINLQKLKQKGAIFHQCDLSLPKSYLTVLEDAEAVFHLAAVNTTSMANAESIIRNTAGISEIFFNSCIEKKVPVIIYTSSVVVLGRSRDKNILITENDKNTAPESPYVAGKVKAEACVDKLIKDYDYDIRRIYPSWVIGEGDSKMTPPHKIICDYVAKGQPFYFPGGISLAYVRSVAQAHVAAFTTGSKQGKYVTAGDNVSFKELYSLLSDYTQHSKPRILLPKFFIVLAASLSKPLFKMMGMEPLIEPSYARAVFGNYSWYDSSKAVKELDYKIIPARQLISEAVEEARKRLAVTLELGFQRLENKADDENKTTILITGVPGWLGNRMLDILINGDRIGAFQSKRKVKLLVQPQHEGLLKLPESFEIVYGDINDTKALDEALEGVSTVFHLAGAIYPKKIKTLYKVNADGSKMLIDRCIEKGVRRFIYMSTDSVAGRGRKSKRVFDENTKATPYKHYGKSKFMAESYLMEKTREGLVDGTSLRAFWFFGTFAPQRQLNFVKMFNWPRQIVFGNGKNYRSISHIDDIVQAFFKAEDNRTTIGKSYWICGDEQYLTVDDIYKTIAEKLGRPYKPFYVPVFMCRLFGVADSMLAFFGYLHPVLHAAGKFYFDIAGKADAAKRDFNYQPLISFDEAAEELKTML